MILSQKKILELIGDAKIIIAEADHSDSTYSVCFLFQYNGRYFITWAECDNLLGENPVLLDNQIFEVVSESREMWVIRETKHILAEKKG